MRPVEPISGNRVHLAEDLQDPMRGGRLVYFGYLSDEDGRALEELPETPDREAAFAWARQRARWVIVRSGAASTVIDVEAECDPPGPTR